MNVWTRNILSHLLLLTQKFSSLPLHEEPGWLRRREPCLRRTAEEVGERREISRLYSPWHKSQQDMTVGHWPGPLIKPSREGEKGEREREQSKKQKKRRRRGPFRLLLPLQTPHLQWSVATNECRGSTVSGWHCLIQLSASAALHCNKETAFVIVMGWKNSWAHIL